MNGHGQISWPEPAIWVICKSVSAVLHGLSEGQEMTVHQVPTLTGGWIHLPVGLLPQTCWTFVPCNCAFKCQAVESHDSFPHKQQKQGLKTNKQSNEHKRTIIIINNLCWKKFQALCQELSRLNWVICCQQHSKSLHPQPGTRSASTENSWALGYCGYWLSAANSWTPGSGQNIFEPMRTYKCNAICFSML